MKTSRLHRAQDFQLQQKASESFDSDFYPTDTSPEIDRLLSEHKSNGNTPIEVSFRNLVPWIYGGSRATHYLHPYPAKLLPQIAHFFLASSVLCPADGVVMDPFAGSGTVVLESILSGRNSIYCDVNPFARALTKAKTTHVDASIITQKMADVERSFESSVAALMPDVVNIGHWYNPEVAGHLAKLKTAIEVVDHESAKNLLLICFSAVAKKLSRANPRFSVPVRLKKDGKHVEVTADKAQVWGTFENIVSKASKKVSCLANQSSLGNASLVASNALKLDEEWQTDICKAGQVDLVITSPPYGGAQKYVRATSLSLGWLGQIKSKELTSIERLTLGREHLPKADINLLPETGLIDADRAIRNIATINQTRAAIAAVFLNEMRTAAEKIMLAVKPDGYAVIVMGDNTICGETFNTTTYVSQLFEIFGGVKVLELTDKIVSRSLQTKRASSSSSMSHETITVFHKRK